MVHIYTYTYSKGEKIQVNAILRIMFECIAKKDISYGNMGFGSKVKNIYPV